MRSIKALLDVPYWLRGWGFQEACANDHVSIGYGRTRCRLHNWGFLTETCLKLVDELHSLGLIEDFFHHRVMLLAPFTTTSKMMHPRRNEGDGSKSENSLIFILVRNCTTTDPRDYIFVLGVLYPELEQLELNYNDTVEEVFTKATFA